MPAPPDPADDQGTAIRSVAAERFGYGTLLPGQETAISAVLRGKDTLAILPTGGGKSAIYQIAGHMTPGATLVVSPLLALQRDQVTSLGHHAVGAAAEMNSTVSRQHREKTFAKLADGDLESLFLAAEQLGHDDVVSALSAATVSPVVVDEAHCVSEWGHDFRPDYLRLGAVIEAMGHPTVVALTATASPPVRDEIIDRLHLRDPAIVVTGFDRPNISLSVETFVEGRDDPGAKREALVERVLAGDGPGIVYCATRRHVDEVAAGLTARGVSAAPYHAGMRTAAREETQESFMGGDVRVIVATTAFGMGIDKADVRFVYHHDISDSVDSYYQEIGRAGRDGEPAEAVLFFAEKDLHLRRFFAGSGGLDNDELARVVELVRHHGGPLPVSALREALGVSETRVVRMVNRLEEVGALTLDADGTACPGERSDDPDDLAGEANRLSGRASRLRADADRHDPGICRHDPLPSPVPPRLLRRVPGRALPPVRHLRVGHRPGPVPGRRRSLRRRPDGDPLRVGAGSRGPAGRRGDRRVVRVSRVPHPRSPVGDRRVPTRTHRLSADSRRWQDLARPVPNRLTGATASMVDVAYAVQGLIDGDHAEPAPETTERSHRGVTPMTSHLSTLVEHLRRILFGEPTPQPVPVPIRIDPRRTDIRRR
ncbi:MAG: RecQ family ATP-dependent DNA helicase [Thermomicrobiales bacterium]